MLTATTATKRNVLLGAANPDGEAAEITVRVLVPAAEFADVDRPIYSDAPTTGADRSPKTPEQDLDKTAEYPINVVDPDATSEYPTDDPGYPAA